VTHAFILKSKIVTATTGSECSLHIYALSVAAFSEQPSAVSTSFIVTFRYQKPIWYAFQFYILYYGIYCCRLSC